jgi:hypothetical protein
LDGGEYPFIAIDRRYTAILFEQTPDGLPPGFVGEDGPGVKPRFSPAGNDYRLQDFQQAQRRKHKERLTEKGFGQRRMREQENRSCGILHGVLLWVKALSEAGRRAVGTSWFVVPENR